MAIQYIGTTISGVAADAKPTLSSNENGVVFIETDTNKMFQWDGGSDTWNEVVASAATTSTRGTASFSSDNFAATAGVITIKDDGVVLGTETTGDYIATIVGTDDQITVTGSGTESRAVTVGLPDNVTISGNLTVSGDTTTVDTSTLAVEDPLISLATGNNTSDAVDIGIYGLYDTSGSQDLYGGFFRDASDGKWRLFKDSQEALGSSPTATTINVSATGYAVGTLVANLEGEADTVSNGVYLSGNQTIGGTKTFSATIAGDISGNAGTVSGGVYTTGDQTIGGTKTFSSTITGAVSGNAGSVTDGVYTSGNQTIGGAKTFTSGISVTAGSYIGNGGGSAVGNIGLLLDHDITSAYPRALVIGNNAATVTSNTGNTEWMQVFPGGTTVPSGQTVAHIASAAFYEPKITNNGTISGHASTVYIGTAPTEAPQDKNWALYVDAGHAKFDGDLQANSLKIFGNNNVASSSTYSGSYGAGGIYADSNWGMILTGVGTPAAADFLLEDSAGNDLVRIQRNSGAAINLAVGGVPETDWADSWSALHLGDKTTLVNYPDNGFFLTDNARYNGSDWKLIEADVASQFAVTNGRLQFRQAVSGSADTAVTWTYPLTIAATTGNVGINNTNPQQLLHVEGGSDPTIFIRQTNANNADSGKLAFGEADNNEQAWIKYDGANNKLKIETIDTSNAFVMNRTNGHIGIGTANPDNKLHISDADDVYIKLTDESVGDSFFVGVDNTGLVFSEDAIGTYRMVINEGGSVGIGLANPSGFHDNYDNLVVGTGTGHNGITIYSQNNSQGGLIFHDAIDTNIAGFVTYDHSIDYMYFGTSGLGRTSIYGGLSPTFRLGIGQEYDTKVLFDGNQVDFHIGLRDGQGSATNPDTLMIGTGTTLGSDTAIMVDTSRKVTILGALKLSGAGTPADGSVLTSDVDGNATWEEASGGGGGAGTAIAMALVFGSTYS